MHAYYLIMCGYFCIEFIYFVLKSQNLQIYLNKSSLPNEYEKNDIVILKVFR